MLPALPCAHRRPRDLADLAPAGIHVETVVVYSAEAADRLPEGVEDEIRDGALDGVLHYSRRSTKIFLDCVDAGGLGGSVQALTHYCLSPRAAEPLAARQFSQIRVAPHPDEAALLDLIAD